MTKHELKTINPYFDDLFYGRKQFEVRFNDDRNFQIGDYLVLREYDTEKQCYTGAVVTAEVGYILNNPIYCKDGYVVLQLIHIRPYATYGYNHF